MILNDFVALAGSNTIVAVELKGENISKTASDWYAFSHDWKWRTVVQWQVETQLYNTVSVTLSHTEVR